MKARFHSMPETCPHTSASVQLVQVEVQKGIKKGTDLFFNIG